MPYISLSLSLSLDHVTTLLPQSACSPDPPPLPYRSLFCFPSLYLPVNGAIGWVPAQSEILVLSYSSSYLGH